MEIDIGRGKKGRRAYGFDDIAIVPSRRTRDPDDIDISWDLGPYRFELPLVASAMDGVVSPDTAVLVNQLGGLGVLNLEGIWTRFENAEERLEQIAAAPKHEATRLMQEIYSEPVKAELVGQEFADGDDLVQGLTELVRLGATEAAITRPDGCVAAIDVGGARRFLEVRTEPLDAVSTVGSGDAFLAGYVAARYDGRPPEDCLAYGVACGAESTQHFGAGTVDRNQVERLLGEVAVHDLEVPAEV